MSSLIHSDDSDRGVDDYDNDDNEKDHEVDNDDDDYYDDYGDHDKVGDDKEKADVDIVYNDDNNGNSYDY